MYVFVIIHITTTGILLSLLAIFIYFVFLYYNLFTNYTFELTNGTLAIKIQTVQCKDFELVSASNYPTQCVVIFCKTFKLFL